MNLPAQDADLKQAILAAVSTQPGVELVILFGLLSFGHGRAESDLDLAIDAGRRLTASEKIALIADLAGRTGRSDPFVEMVMREAVPL